jgi:GTPase SAR1 family protein
VEATVGAAYSTKRMTVRDTQSQLQLWDTVSQEPFKTLAQLHFRGSKCEILTFRWRIAIHSMEINFAKLNSF